jgi:TolB protein
LAYIGGDGNVYLAWPNRPDRLAMTVDATAPAEGNGRSYHRLAWSLDGQLAFAAVERKDAGVSSTVYVATPGQPPHLLGQSADHFVIYLFWSPQGCTGPAVCHLAYLIEGEEAIDLHLVQWGNHRPVANRVVGSGRPFYFTWSPDGRQMLWHTGGALAYHPEAALTRYQVMLGESERLTAAPGLFLAPAWSPGGESWLAGVASADGRTTLRQVTPGREPSIEIVQNGFDIAFAWSPNGQQIAYAVRGAGDDPFLGPIYLYDLASQRSRRLTDESLHVQAFFWSPDGQRIAYIHWLSLPNESWAQWRVYDLTTAGDRGFQAFYPSLPMRMVIGSFNQFAQSHRFWSPDSRYLLYADRARYLTERIWLVDTWAAREANPILVDEGAIGVWSWQ